MSELARDPSQLYCTPSDVWSLAFPKTISASDFVPGITSAIIKTAMGSGDMQLATAYPHDAYLGLLKVTFAGDIGTARAKFSTDNGVSFSPEFLITDQVDLFNARMFPTGISVSFVNGASPSFLVNDQYAFTSTAPPEFLDQITTTCDDVDDIIGYKDDGGRYHLPLIAWPRSLTRVVAKIVRFELLVNRGFDSVMRDRIYRDERDGAMEWLTNVAKYLIHPKIVDSNPRPLAPSVIQGYDTFGIRTPRKRCCGEP